MSSIPSFIHTFFKKNKFSYKPTNIDSASNGIWLKNDSVSNPDNNKLTQLRTIELLGLVTQNAVSPDKQGVNYMLWSDIESSWHFKRLDSIISGPKPKITLYNAPGSNIEDKVFHIKVINSHDNITSLEDKIFHSSYIRIDPDYTNSYIDFTDTTSGTTSSIQRYNYDTAFSKTTHLYPNKLISHSTFPVKGSTSGINVATNIVKTEYGYFDLAQYNTDTPVWWDYLGKNNDKFNNISWQTQYDITDKNFSTFYTIHTKIRVPLIQKRLDFAKLKNIKRKWEAYRCVVCCMDQPIGCAADILDFAQAIKDPYGSTFNSLFGKNGLFVNKPILSDYINLGGVADINAPYAVVAAGSFTDQLNYNKAYETTWQNGITYSRDLKKAPYNETIGTFYNIGNEDSTQVVRYQTEIINNGTEKYTKKIDDNNKRLEVISTFLSKIDGYITNSIEFIHFNLVQCSRCLDLRSSVTSLIENNNYWSKLRESNSNNIYDYVFGGEPGNFQSTSCGNDSSYGGPTIPVFQKSIGDNGSAHNGISPNRGNTGSYHEIEGIGRINNFEIPQYTCLRTINFNYDWSSGQDSNPNKITDTYIKIYDELLSNPIGSNLSMNLNVRFQYVPLWAIELSKDVFMRGKDQEGATAEYYNTQSSWGVKETCTGSVCYNEHCFNPNLLIALKEIAYRQRNSLKVENHMLNKVKGIVVSGLKAKWKNQYKEWINRKAFFHSKLPGKSIFTGSTHNGYRGTTLLSQPLSLQGIKSITRKDIRGSRYEILSKSKGITGASMGTWLYEVFFDEGNGGNAPSLSGNTANPYYDQKYKPVDWFFTDRHTIRKKIIETKLKYYSNKYKSGLDTEYVFKDSINVTEIRGVSGDGIITSQDPPIEIGMDSTNYVYSFNIFNVTSTKKPANLKREEIASYIRIEFDTPIGLDRIQDFPDGFIRNAGVEYFLPYLVSLTPGPTGRQTVRNNIAIIGMDPYGFDVAVKKMKVESASTSENGLDITQTQLSRNGMDLWPEPMFETKYPYYASDTRGIYSYSTETSGTNSNKSAEVDPERRKTAMGSGVLMGSHRKIKPHRSWWSFYMPHNIFIPQKIYSLLTTDMSNIFQQPTNENTSDFDDILAFNPDEETQTLFKSN